MDVAARGIAPYNNSFETLVKDLKQFRRNGYRVLLLSGSRTRAKRLAEDLRDYFELIGVTADRFTAITFRCDDIERVEQIVKNSSVSLYRKRDNRLWFRTGQETILEFES